jgi:hypothetical protein
VAAVLVAVGAVFAALLLVALWIRFTAPPGEVPAALSGQRTTRSFDLAGFSQISTSGQWQVTLVRGDAWAVEASYPVELERFIEVRREGAALALRYNLDQAWWSDFGSNEELGISARVVMPTLDALHLTGATRLDFSGFDGARLVLEASGASSVDGRDSRFRALQLDISGAGHADLGGVPTTDAHVDVSGAQRVTLQLAGGSLSGELTGASRLEYSGSASSQRVHTSGVSRVEHRE